MLQSLHCHITRLSWWKPEDRRRRQATAGDCSKKASIRWQDSAPPLSGGTYGRRRTL